MCADMKLGFIDFRASQIEASDVRGLPDKKDGRTVYLPPADMPMGGMTWEQLSAELGKILGNYNDNDSHPLDPILVDVMVEKLKGEAAKADTPEKQGELDTLANRLLRFFVEAQPKLNRGILFLDELNRGQDDVLQAAFQLVLDRKVGLYSLPPGWTIVAAGNFMEGYQTNGFTDPAFLNRFCHLTLSADEQTLPEWIDYISDKHGEQAAPIIEFASQNIDHLHGKDLKNELGFNIMPSPRSWEAVIRVEKEIEKADLGTDARLAVLSGLIGRDLATSYMNYSCPVKVQDVISKGIAGVKNDLERLDRKQLQGLVWGLAGFLKKRVEEEKFGTIALDFIRWLAKHGKDKDIAIVFATTMVSGGPGPQRIKSAMISNPNVAKLVSQFSNDGKSFGQRLARDPELRDLVSKVAWFGSTENTKKV
jgi:hypothetical protein